MGGKSSTVVPWVSFLLLCCSCGVSGVSLNNNPISNGLFSDPVDACLKQLNNEIIDGITLEECKEKCSSATSFICHSLDYEGSISRCHLSEESKKTQPSAYTEPCYDGTDSTYLEQIFNDCVREENINYNGNNLRHARNYIKVDSVHECAKWCGITDRCKYWTFRKSNGVCRLKHSNADRRTDSDATSGTKGCGKGCKADEIITSECMCGNTSCAVGSVCAAGSICTPGQGEWTGAVWLNDDSTQVVKNIKEKAFNALFSGCPVVKYSRNGAVHSIYVRTSPIPPSFNAFSVFTNNWTSTSNELNTDFRLYDDLNDAHNDRGAWNFCNYDDGPGYPRDCGKNGKVIHRWFQMPSKGQSMGIASGIGFDIYTGSTCPFPQACKSDQKITGRACMCQGTSCDIGGICTGGNTCTPGCKADETITSECTCGSTSCAVGSVCAAGKSCTRVSNWKQMNLDDCWSACGKTDGSCPGFCGSTGYCCRKGYNGCPPGAGEASPSKHTCVTQIADISDEREELVESGCQCMQEINNTTENMEKKIVELENQNNRFQNTTENMENKIVELENQNNIFQDTVENMQKKNVELENQNTNFQNTTENMQKKIVELENQNNNFQDTTENMQKKIIELENQNKNFQDTAENRQKKIIELENQNNNFQDQLNTLGDRLAKLQILTHSREVCFEDMASPKCEGSQSGQVGIVEAIRVDGGWGQWQEWSQCSLTCGGGSQVRHRTCDNPEPQHGGKSCIGFGEDGRKCNEEEC